MRRQLRLMIAVFSVSLRRDLAHRTNLVLGIAFTAVDIAAALAALGIVYSQTETLAGWTFGEAAVLLGTYEIVSGLLWTFIEPNVQWFAGQVTGGKLDEVLLKPVPSILTASLGTCAPLSLSHVVLGVAVLVVGLTQMGSAPSALGVLAWLALLAAAAAATWATRILLASLAFWAPHTELDVLYGAVWQFGRYPVGIYRQPIRALLTYVLPVALISTAPARALMHAESAWPLLPIGVAGAMVLVALARWVWDAGLRRYTSATS